MGIKIKEFLENFLQTVNKRIPGITTNIENNTIISTTIVQMMIYQKLLKIGYSN